MRFNPNTLVAVTASAALLAGCSGENIPVPENPEISQQQTPGQTYDKVVVNFAEAPWSTATPQEKQQKALQDVKTGLQNLYDSSFGKGFDPADVPVINAGTVKLEGVGEVKQLCSSEGTQALHNKVVDAVQKSAPQNVGETVLSYIVFNGIDQNTCAKEQTTEVGLVGGATTNLGQSKVVIWGDNTEHKAIGTYIAAHEGVHAPPYNLTTTTATMCGPEKASGRHGEPETSQDIPLSKKDCTVALLRDFNTITGHDSDKQDMFSGPELMSLGAITNEQVVTLEKSGQPLRVKLDALQNPTHSGQKKLIRVPSAEVMDFPDLIALGGDIYIELSKGSEDGQDGSPLSIKAYLANKDVVAGNADSYSKPPSIISTASHSGSKNTNAAGKGLSLVGTKGKLSVTINSIDATASDKGSAELSVQLSSI